jgi:hypothetical protein
MQQRSQTQPSGTESQPEESQPVAPVPMPSEEQQPSDQQQQPSDQQQQPSDQQQQPSDQQQQPMGTESGAMIQSDEGVVQSVTDDEIVLQRDNGSQLRIQLEGQQATQPSIGERVHVQYRMENMQPVLVQLDRMNDTSP